MLESTKDEIVLGVLRNMRSSAISDRFLREAANMGVSTREIDLASCREVNGAVWDTYGVVRVTHLLPGTTYGEEAGARAVLLLEENGVRVLNTAHASSIADDKLLIAEAFSRAGVPQPDWVRVEPGQLESALAVGLPLVLKRPVGALGMWNRLVREEGELRTAAAELSAEGETSFIAQRAVMEALGTSVRAVVLDGEVLAATELRAQDGEWRSNGALGATGYDTEVGAGGRLVVEAAAAAVGLRYAGVDLIKSQRGWLVLEVNAGSPFDGAERRTGKNIAERVIRALLG